MVTAKYYLERLSLEIAKKSISVCGTFNSVEFLACTRCYSFTANVWMGVAFEEAILVEVE